MKVNLLYECDSWLSTSSMVLRGVFTNDDSLGVSLWELIRSHRGEHVRGGDLCDYLLELDGDEFVSVMSEDERADYVFDDFVEDVIKELFDNGQTQGLSVNYMLVHIETDSLID